MTPCHARRELLLFACFAIATQAPAADFSAWQFTQPLPVTATGLTSVELPTATLHAARAQLEDLRVISPSGVETPFVIQWPEIQPERLIDPSDFSMKLIDGATELSITTGTNEPIRAIRLRAAEARFLKAARVEASPDGSNWQTLVANTVIFREPGDIESVVIKLTPTPQSHAHLRVVLDDQLSRPVAFSGARLEVGSSVPEEKPLPVKIVKREELKGRSRLTLDLGGKNVFVASVRVMASDAVFSRRATVSTAENGDPNTAKPAVGSATIFRVALADRTNESLDIAVRRSIASDKLTLEIENSDSPPLKIETVEITQYPVRILFHADAAGEWRLITGNALVAAPRYDIAALKQQLAGSTASQAAAGAITTNASYTKPNALPEVDAASTDVDLARSRFRKPVTIAAPGVIAITLDPEVLAHSQLSLGDLRLVQDGRQVPYLVERTGTSAEPFVEPAVSLKPDPKRPQITRWTLTMPVDSFPASRLTCESNTPLFERSITASGAIKDSFGNDTRLHLGSAQWTHKPGDASNAFELRFGPDHLPQSFALETDNGDNPPIEITRVRVHYATVRLIAKITTTSPLHLYYGNDRAKQPQYDLQLVRGDLMAAPKENGAIGAEEKLTTSRDQDRTSCTGSPWLWAALAAVIGVLLWVVAKMLPAPER